MAEPTLAPKRPASSKPVEAPAKPSTVLYVSRADEPYQWDIVGVRGLRSQAHPGRVVWKVPAEKVEHFERHHFYLTGRAQKAP